jgi:hypothetical protein
VARWGWPLPTACMERRNLAIRQWVAAGGRRGTPLGPGDAGWREQVAWCQVAPNFVWPHASLRQAWLVPDATHGRGAAKRGRPWTPAMAAGWPEHVWSLQEV